MGVVDDQIQEELSALIPPAGSGSGSSSGGIVRGVWENYDIGRHDEWAVPPGGFDLDPLCWAAGLDFHGVGTWQSGIAPSSFLFGATLLAPDIVISAHHSGLGPEDGDIHFIRSDGSVYDATILSGSAKIGGDIKISRLTASVPIDISHYSVVSRRFSNFLEFNVENLGDTYPPDPATVNGMSGKPFIFLDQYRDAYAGRIYNLPDVGIYAGIKISDYDYPERAAHWKGPMAPGDSGWPSFMLAEGSLVFTGAHWVPGASIQSDANILPYYDEINAEMTSQGSSYQLTEWWPEDVINSPSKRAAIPGVARPFKRGKRPGIKNTEWRWATGNTYGGNFSPPEVEAVPLLDEGMLTGGMLPLAGGLE